MLAFRSVIKSFPTGSPALNDVSFVIDKGEFVFLTGPSGAGKTTLMKLLTRNTQTSRGEILFQKNNISELKSKDLYNHKRQVGVVFQDYKLLHELNAWENIALALEIAGDKQANIEQRVTDLLKLVNLTDKAFLFPSQLSGGEAQRISIARALASAPAMIFADEPTGNLDPKNSLSIIKLLKKINDLGTTILVATHDQGLLDQFKKARRIHLEDGKIMEDTGGKPKDEKNKPIEIKNKDKKSKKNEDVINRVSGKKPRITLPKIRFPFGKKSSLAKASKDKISKEEALEILEETAESETKQSKKDKKNKVDPSAMLPPKADGRDDNKQKKS
ncbi:MAG: cell division ATP-binding protein FtsE [Patescibacteria group bacterium]